MKMRSLIFLLLFCAAARAADLPTVSMEHLYYLQARSERIRGFKPDDMIEYCIAQKVGGSAFEYLNSQLSALRVELAKLLEIEKADPADPRVEQLKKSCDVYLNQLRDEAQKVQRGMIREGQIATDTLQAIARAQNSR